MNQLNGLKATTHVVNTVVGHDEVCPVCLKLCDVINDAGIAGLPSEDRLVPHKAPHNGPNLCDSGHPAFGRHRGKMLPCTHKLHSFEKHGDYCPRCSVNMKK